MTFHKGKRHRDLSGGPCILKSIYILCRNVRKQQLMSFDSFKVECCVALQGHRRGVLDVLKMSEEMAAIKVLKQELRNSIKASSKQIETSEVSRQCRCELAYDKFT